MVTLVEERVFRRTRYKETFEEAKILVTMRTIKRTVWGYVVDVTIEHRN